jgi:hypothetical protein
MQTRFGQMAPHGADRSDCRGLQPDHPAATPDRNWLPEFLMHEDSFARGPFNRPIDLSSLGQNTGDISALRL